MLAKEIDIVLGATRVDSQKLLNFHRLVILSMKLALQCLNVVNFFFRSRFLYLSTAKCPSGMFKSSKTDCSLCAAGTYNNQQGQLQCNLACPAGTSSLPGAKSSSDCKRKLDPCFPSCKFKT